MGKQKKTDALSERHFVQRAPLIPLIPFLQFDIGHKYIGTNNQPEKKNFSFNFRMQCLLLLYYKFIVHCSCSCVFMERLFQECTFCEKGGKHIIFLFENSPRVAPSIFQQENICRWTPREISFFDPKF